MSAAHPEIRERTAVALYRLLSERNGRSPQWESHNEHFQNQWRTRADAFLSEIGVTAEIAFAQCEMARPGCCIQEGCFYPSSGCRLAPADRETT